MAGERSTAEGRSLQERHGDSSCRIGHAGDLQLEAPEPAGADEPAADAAAQRHRGVEHHEKDGLAAMPPARPLTCRKAYCAAFRWT